MYRTILVPLDGSPLAEQALPLARALAHASEARVILLRAVQPPLVPSAEAAYAGEPERSLREAEAYLGRVVERLHERGIVETAAFPGDPAEAVVQEARLRKADLVVMATHARSGLDRFVHGSVAGAVLARSSVPVLLVRAAEAYHRAPTPERRTLLVPLDGSPFSEEALPVAAEAAQELQAEIVLMQCIAPPEHARVAEDGRIVSYLDQQVETLRAQGWDYLHGIGAWLAERYGVARPRLDVRVGTPAEAIVEAADDHGAVLVVMATHGRTGLARLLVGSVTDAVLHRGTTPLLLVRPALVHQAA